MQDNTKKLIGQRINEALAKKGVMQKELAQVLGVTDNTISYFVSGKRVPNTEQIINIANALDVSTDFLLGISENMTTDTDLQAVCEYTGLSEDAIQCLRQYKEYTFTTEGLEIFDFISSFIQTAPISDIWQTLKQLKAISQKLQKNRETLNFTSEKKAWEYFKQKGNISKELFALCGDRAEIIDFIDGAYFRIYKLQNTLLSAFLSIGNCSNLVQELSHLPNDIERRLVRVNGEGPVFFGGCDDDYFFFEERQERGDEFINKYTVKEGVTDGDNTKKGQ